MKTPISARTIVFLATATLALASLQPRTAPAALRLAPQTVVDAVLKHGFDARDIQLQAQKAELLLGSTMGAFDWGFSASTNYELTRLETLSGLSNLEDRNRKLTVGFNKSFSTATNLTLGFNRTYQNSITSSFLSTAHPPNQVLDYVDLQIKQDLLSNFLGIQDRRRIRIAKREVDRADLAKRESLESLVLNAISLYWRAYVSEASLREAIEAREKYGVLTKSVERKVRLGLAEPPDLAKVRIEHSAQDRRVKSASLQYLSDLERLFSAAQIPYEKDVEFDVSLDLPPPAEEQVPVAETLRPVQAAQILVENAQDGLANARMNTLPKLNLFGQVSFNGVDRQSDQSFSELTSGVHPRYLVGIEMTYPLWSEGLKTEAKNRELLQDEAFNALNRTREQQKLELQQAERNVRSNYIIAKMAKENVTKWQQILVDRERLFRNARVGTAEIIQDYSLYFRAKSDAVAAIADYYYSTHRLRAAKDELVP